MSLPPPSPNEALLAETQRALRIALVFLVVGPIVGAALGVGGIFLGVQTGSAAFTGLLGIVLGSSAGVPGIVLGYRALKRTRYAVATATAPADADAARRARSRARITILLGVLASGAATTLAFCISFVIMLSSMGAPGRPLRRRGRQVKAGACRDEAWCGAVPDVPPLEDAERARRAARWLEDARAEHASIASFCDVTLDLLSLGAPPALIEQSLRAAADEVAHARLAFELARAFSGEARSPSPLREASHGDAVARLRLAASSVVDGRINEGIAATRAADEARTADNDAERAALARIAEDEARHAALGQRIAAWAIGRAAA